MLAWTWLLDGLPGLVLGLLDGLPNFMQLHHVITSSHQSMTTASHYHIFSSLLDLA
jgi:hypothetical protein